MVSKCEYFSKLLYETAQISLAHANKRMRKSKGGETCPKKEYTRIYLQTCVDEAQVAYCGRKAPKFEHHTQFLKTDMYSKNGIFSAFHMCLKFLYVKSCQIFPTNVLN